MLVMIQKLKGFVSSNKKELAFLFLVFLLAFGIRGHQFIYEFFFEFDGYYHARMTEYVMENGKIPGTDPLAYYYLPNGLASPQFQDGPFWWLFTGSLFRILTLGAPLDNATWYLAIKLFPALFGSLVCIAMYFLGKEMYGRRAGAIMAIFAAVVPAFVYRTMAGWFEGQSLGFLWMVLGFIFFIRAIKNGALSKSTVLNSLIAGFFFAVMAWNWQAYLMVPYILLGFFSLTALILFLRFIFLSEPAKTRLNVMANTCVAFFTFLILASLVIGTVWIEAFQTNFLHVIRPGGAIDLAGAGQTAGSVFSVSVGEESKGLSYWGNKYNALSVFIGWPVTAGTQKTPTDPPPYTPVFPWYVPGLVFIFLLYRLVKNKDDHASVLALIWIGFAIYLAYIKLKFTFYLGLPVALAAGITLNELLSFMGERPGFEKKLIGVGAGFMLLVGVAAGAFFITQNTPNIEYDTGWKESLKWIAENTPADSKLFNWWDEGHWITFIARRAVSTDNRNGDLNSNSDYSLFLLSGDENAAVAILNSRYDPDYVLTSEDLLEKMGSLGIYAYQTTNNSDPRVSRFMGITIPCQKVTDPLSRQTYMQCGQNILADQQFSEIPTRWIEQPNQTIGGTEKVFIYRNEAGNKIFIFNKAANDTFIVRLFFDKENLKHFQEVYSYKEVRLFKYLP